ncbi:MgtC/SapB family protein [Lapidilactobacillus achengensis]|uniref:MgtC/SapB family protein n=1 Tax=Lapidilactobacillus achengensis TaxID=2486000 RepID=A0ABW1UMZ4_9LACO|nr:MgtC/SapB family protein [Lapidilactobacillus achengensis]
MLKLTLPEIAIRLIIATFLAGLIGYDREQKNHPAGIRTHILVCVGACLLALIQQGIVTETLSISKDLPAFSGIIRSDPARLIAQAVSGIGFLGAGTIVVTRHSIMGLTTAASLWATMGLGLATGMGFYDIALVGTSIVLLVLVILKKVIRIRTFKKMELKYVNRKETIFFLNQYFKDKKILIDNSSFRADSSPSSNICTSIYFLDLPKGVAFSDIVSDLSMNMDILQVRFINI